MLPRINLADYKARELAEEMVRRIPAHTPEWRNPRTGDPGRAIIDLFAWLGETVLYRANLTPRRMRMEFLNLLNLKQFPAKPASGLISLAHKSPKSAKPVFAPAGARLPGAVPFETLNPATVQPLTGQVYIKRRLDEDERAGLADVIDSLSDLYGVDVAEPYVTEALFPDPNSAIKEGVDPLSDSVDRTIWIALLALENTDGSRSGAFAALDAQPAMLNVGFIPRIENPDPDPDAEPLVTPEDFQWSVTAKTTAGAETSETYFELAIDDDRTGGLSKEGTLRLALPASNVVHAPANDVGADVEAGVGDRPPRLDDPEIADRLICWLRLRPADPDGVLSLSWLGINAVMVDQRESFSNVVLGTASGQAGQRYDLPAQNFDPETLSVSVHESGLGFRPWAQVTDLGACGREDRCFELDAEAGSILFGDGLTGKAPETGSRVRLDFGRAGGGAEGNVAAGSLTAVELPGMVANQPAAMHGGEPSETLEAAEKRVTSWLQHRNRCVTEDDYRAIAGELNIGRIEVLPRFRPYQRQADSAGVVSVMVFPSKAVRRPANPRADRRLLDRVRAHLEPRRPLGTEFYVIGTEYIRLGASVAIGIREGFAREEVVRSVKETLYAFLWPLVPGGRDGAGWPLGQAVNNREIEVQVARVPGVRTTQGVNLFSYEETGFETIAPDPQTGMQILGLEIWQLPELMQVDVAVDASAPPSDMTDRTGGLGQPGAGAIAVPVVPEVC